MGLFKRAMKAYAQNEKKRAGTLVNAEYIGGYEEREKNIGNLSLYNQKAEFSVAFNSRASFTIPFSEIKDINIEGRDEVSRRVTVTRLLAVGIFAFALKKKDRDKESFITLVLTNGQEAIFRIKNKSPMELKAMLAEVTLQIRQARQA